MKYYVLCWFTVRNGTIRHSGTWYSLADTQEAAEKKLRSWISRRYPGQQIMIHQQQVLPC